MKNSIKNELSKANGMLKKRREDLIRERIRQRYDLEDELKIQRRRDTHPEEFEEYNSYVEAVIAETDMEMREVTS